MASEIVGMAMAAGVIICAMHYGSRLAHAFLDKKYGSGSAQYRREAEPGPPPSTDMIAERLAMVNRRLENLEEIILNEPVETGRS